MVTIACPWCERELALGGPPPVDATLRCDECASVVDLAPLTTTQDVPALPLAA